MILLLMQRAWPALVVLRQVLIPHGCVVQVGDHRAVGEALPSDVAALLEVDTRGARRK